MEPPPDDPSVRVVAEGRSTRTGRAFNLVVAAERTRGDDGRLHGRLIAHSSFHHLCDYNWDLTQGCATRSSTIRRDRRWRPIARRSTTSRRTSETPRAGWRPPPTDTWPAPGDFEPVIREQDLLADISAVAGSAISQERRGCSLGSTGPKNSGSHRHRGDVVSTFLSARAAVLDCRACPSFSLPALRA